MFFCLDRFYEYIESIKIYKKPAKYTTHCYENHLHLCMIQYWCLSSWSKVAYRSYYCYPNTAKGFYVWSFYAKSRTQGYNLEPRGQTRTVIGSVFCHDVIIVVSCSLFLFNPTIVSFKNTIHTSTSETNFGKYLVRVNLRTAGICLCYKYFSYYRKSTLVSH